MRRRFINFCRRKQQEIKGRLQSLAKKSELFFLEWTNRKLFGEIRPLLEKQKGIQLEFNEILSIAKVIRRFSSCRLLVFGLGNDSAFWKRINKKGRSVFLEDHEDWFNQIVREYPELEAYLIKYPCNITQWRELLGKPEQLRFELPAVVQKSLWDVILVDGPMGYEINEKLPGRMSSIYAAARLVAPGGFIFVHDAEREVETAYCARFLRNEHLMKKTVGRALLNQYHYPRMMKRR